MRHVIRAFGLVLVLSLGTYAQPQEDLLIVPGERISALALTMTADDFTRVLGSQFRAGTDTGVPRTRWHDWRARAFRILVCDDSVRVIQLGFYRPADRGLHESVKRYRTKEGISLGAPLQDVIDKYGQPLTVYSWGGGWRGFPFANGLYVNTDGDNRVGYGTCQHL